MENKNKVVILNDMIKLINIRINNIPDVYFPCQMLKIIINSKIKKDIK